MYSKDASDKKVIITTNGSNVLGKAWRMILSIFAEARATLLN